MEGLDWLERVVGLVLLVLRDLQETQDLQDSLVSQELQADQVQWVRQERLVFKEALDS